MQRTCTDRAPGDERKSRFCTSTRVCPFPVLGENVIMAVYSGFIGACCTLESTVTMPVASVERIRHSTSYFLQSRSVTAH